MKSFFFSKKLFANIIREKCAPCDLIYFWRRFLQKQFFKSYWYFSRLCPWAESIVGYIYIYIYVLKYCKNPKPVSIECWKGIDITFNDPVVSTKAPLGPSKRETPDTTNEHLQYLPGFRNNMYYIDSNYEDGKPQAWCEKFIALACQKSSA